jgi:hypothetical protein
MKTLLTWLFIFVFGFIVGAGVGFKILEGVSTDLLLEAWDNSYTQFQQTYPGSTAQQQLSKKVDEQKQVLIENIKNGLKDQLMSMFSFGSTPEVTE